MVTVNEFATTLLLLVNPALLKDVSDDTMQSWIQQYPYVSAVSFVRIKRKINILKVIYTKQHFISNNREKLYFLLNDKQFESKVVPAYEKTTQLHHQ